MRGRRGRGEPPFDRQPACSRECWGDAGGSSFPPLSSRSSPVSRAGAGAGGPPAPAPAGRPEVRGALAGLALCAAGCAIGPLHQGFRIRRARGGLAGGLRRPARAFLDSLETIRTVRAGRMVVALDCPPATAPGSRCWTTRCWWTGRDRAGQHRDLRIGWARSRYRALLWRRAGDLLSPDQRPGPPQEPERVRTFAARTSTLCGLRRTWRGSWFLGPAPAQAEASRFDLLAGREERPPW